MASAIEKYEENVTSKRCGRATFTECVPLPPEARGLNASTAGSHKTYNSWRARSCFEHTKQAKVGGQSAGPKACLALLAERKQQRMLSRRRERPPFKRFVSLSGPHAETARRLWKLVNLAGNGYFRDDLDRFAVKESLCGGHRGATMFVTDETKNHSGGLWVHCALRRNFVRRYGKILPTTDDCSDPDHWIELVEIYRLIRRKKNVTLFFFRT